MLTELKNKANITVPYTLMCFNLKSSVRSDRCFMSKDNWSALCVLKKIKESQGSDWFCRRE